MNKRPYKNNNIDYIYSLEYERIIIFPIGIIYNLLDMWEIIIEGVEKKLTFHQVKKRSENFFLLEEYCNNEILNIDEHKDNSEKDYQFYFPYTYNPDLEIFNENIIMETYLPKTMLNKIADFSFTGYGEEIISIDIKLEKELKNYCNANKIKIKRDDGLIDDCINGGYRKGIFN
tara:strand:+ start:2256 stop:2777 length:522 start_codon:yes stop_codon:yes gene_type:complete